jgi:hypothetical protein
MQSGMLTTERIVLNCILYSKENEMNPIITSQPTTPRNAVRIFQTLFTVLACASLIIGSVLISYVWLRMSPSGIGATESLTLLMTTMYLVPILFFAWLLGTAALLLARRWVAAGLALPVALGVFLGLYLFMWFVIPHVPAPTLVFIALLFPLNGAALWLARRFLTDTGRKTF